MPKTVFYARLSTRDQNPALQIDAAKKLGVKSDDIFVEKASGSRHYRPVLAQVLAACAKGDTLACYKLDRVGRSLGAPDKAARRSRSQGRALPHRRRWARHARLDGKPRCTRWALSRSLNVIELSKANTRRPGGCEEARQAPRPPVKWQADMARKAQTLMSKGDLNAEEVARTLQVSRRTLFRGLKAARDQDELVGG